MKTSIGHCKVAQWNGYDENDHGNVDERIGVAERKHRYDVRKRLDGDCCQNKNDQEVEIDARTNRLDPIADVDIDGDDWQNEKHVEE